MNCNTGEVMSIAHAFDQIAARPSDRKFYKEVPFQAIKPKTGRNEPCPCGSGVKFKKCCYMAE